MSKTDQKEASPGSATAISPHHPGQRLLVLALMAGVAAAGTVAWWPALNSGAMRGFDVASVSSRTLRNPSGANVLRVFQSSVRGVYQPLPIISLMADTAAGGTPTDVRPYHRTSLGLHALNSALAVWLLYLLFGSPWAAALAGLLFALHPLAVEPLASISQRSIILATTFSLLSLIAYTRYAQRASWWRYLAALLAMTAALLCEPITITLPLIMLLLDWWPLRRLAPETVVEKIPAILLAAAAGVVFVLHPGVDATGMGLPASRIPLIAAHNLMFYLGKAFWPARLSPYYAPPQTLALTSGPILAAIIASLVLLIALLMLARRLPVLLTGMVIFFLAILPSTQMMRFSDSMAATRFGYLPLLGLAMIAAALLARLFKGSRYRQALAACLVLVVCTTEGLAARHQLGYWRDTETLVRRMTALNPDSIDLHAELGEVLIAKGKHQEGIEQLRTVCKLHPESASAHRRLGLALAGEKQFAAASEELTRALQIQPDLTPAYADLGHVLTQLNRFQDAADVLVRLADVTPWDSMAQFNVGVALQRLGKRDEAISRYRKAIEADAKNADARKNLAMCLLDQGEKDKALEQLREAAKLQPESSMIRSNLGGVLREVGKLDESETECREAIRREPKSAKLHVNLALTLEARSKPDEAMQEYRRAVELDPNSPDAHFLLGNLLSRRHKRAEAVKEYSLAVQVAPDFAPARAALQAIMAEGAVPQQ